MEGILVAKRRPEPQGAAMHAAAPFQLTAGGCKFVTSVLGDPDRQSERNSEQCSELSPQI
jgi:hypothetical protein